MNFNVALSIACLTNGKLRDFSLTEIVSPTLIIIDGISHLLPLTKM
jgi:hypothetical protein